MGDAVSATSKAAGTGFERKSTRRIRMNIWGNWNGYEGTRKVRSFGTDELGARDWLETGL